MAYKDLLAAITDPRLIEFAEAWRAARGKSLVPRWRDLDIGLMKRCLANVWAWEYDPATEIFRGKLAGEEIQSVLGRGFRGALAHHYFKNHAPDVVIEYFRQVVLGGQGAVSSGSVFSFAGSFAEGDRVAFPIATRSSQADTVIGVTFYKFSERTKRVIATDARPGKAAFFSLED